MARRELAPGCAKQPCQHKGANASPPFLGRESIRLCMSKVLSCLNLQGLVTAVLS
ncbi:uncharacterized protein METZ01_LOCUS288777, partial [marine metagenome]